MRWAGHAVRKGERSGVHVRLGLQSQKERDHLEDIDKGGRVILILRRSAMYWIDLTQDKEQWRAIVITVTNFWFP
jgi:hypothetical protein